MSIGNFVFKDGQHLDIGYFHATILNHWRDKQGRKVYKYQCDICNTIHEKYEHLIENGSGCPVCSNRIVVKGINDIPTTDPWMIDYFPGGEEEASKYTSNCSKKFIPKCPYCGRLRDKPITPNAIFSKKGMACVCKDGLTIPNKFIYGLSEQLKKQEQIESFTREYITTDENRVTRRFDMLLEDKERNLYFVEMDGGYNHGNVIKENKKSKGNQLVSIPSKYFYVDLMKDNISNNLNIPLIRIDCYKSDFEYIKNNVINSELSKIFDLNKIDWNKILALCYGNLIKNVCKYKLENPNCFSTEAAEKFNLSRYTIVAYWKYGTTLGWCYYDPHEEMTRSNTRFRPSSTNTPIIVKNLVTNEIHEFPSLSEFLKNKDKEKIIIPLTKKQLETRFNRYNNSFIYEDYKITKLKSKKEDTTNGVKFSKG